MIEREHRRLHRPRGECTLGGMSLPEQQDPGTKDDESKAEAEEPKLIGTFAAARSASERDTCNTLEVGPRWPFSS